MKVTIVLHDACASAMLHETAKRYALLCVKSRMPADIGNAPWVRGASTHGPKAHRLWMAGIDRDRAAYRKSLLSLVPEIPEVPDLPLKPLTSPSGRKLSGMYSTTVAGKIAGDWADGFVRLVSGT